jgi:hypothetical protein
VTQTDELLVRGSLGIVWRRAGAGGLDGPAAPEQQEVVS